MTIVGSLGVGKFVAQRNAFENMHASVNCVHSGSDNGLGLNGTKPLFNQY